MIMFNHNCTAHYKILLLFTIIFTCTQNISAETWNSSGFYLATGNKNITANEIVYRQSATVTDYKLSHLIWQTQNAPVSLFGLRHRLTDFIIFNIEGQVLDRQSKSVMDDYDWTYTNTSDWSDWSHHEDTRLTQAAAYNLSLVFTLIGNTKNYFSIVTGYKNETIAWKSFGGTYVYSENSFRDSSGSFTDGSPAIDYKQEYATPYYGVKLGTLFGNWLYTLQATTSNNVKLVATDVHHARNLIFKDTFAAGRMNNYKLGIGYLFGDRFSINFIYDVQDYAEARGNTVRYSTVTGKVTGGCVNCAGSDNISTSATIGVSLYF